MLPPTRLQTTRPVRVLGLFFTALLLQVAAAREVTPGPDLGEAIYRNGVLASGKPLVGTHRTGVRRHGADAACVNCHRRSGLGAVEGRSAIPPITARYLFRPRAAKLEDLPIAILIPKPPLPGQFETVSIPRALRSAI